MKKTFTFLFVSLLVVFAFGQRPEGVFKKATVAPEINGVLDAAWDDANVYNINRPFESETPTVGAEGETNWRALWNNDGVFIFVTVKDDVWFPAYSGTGDEWTFDKIELYFDVNSELQDGGGGGGGNGHYQVAPSPNEDLIDGTPTTWDSGVIWAYKVNNPDYTLEVFVPWSHLRTGVGGPFDKTADMGFDVTVIDRDSQEGSRQRMVWANNTDPESWNSLDDVGYVKMEGAEAGILIDEITLVGGNEITRNKGSIYYTAEITPEDATNQAIKWIVENRPGQTGIATITNDGRLKALKDGTVTVVAEATDNSYAYAEIEVTMSNQKPTRWDFNNLRNGLLNDVDNNGNAVGWVGWIDETGTRTLEDGVFVNTITTADPDARWRFQTAQEPVYRPLVQGETYEFSFTAWADAPRNINAGFEDPSNGFRRFGATDDAQSPDGRSEWTYAITAEPERYTVDVTFDEILDNTFQKFVFALAEVTGVVYLDSILVIRKDLLDDVYPDDTRALYIFNYGVVEVDGSTNGTITAKLGDDTLESGADVEEQLYVELTAVPAENYMIKAWMRNGVVIPDHTENTLTHMVRDDVTIEVEFESLTSIIEKPLSQLKVYPNPFSNTIHIANTENVKRVLITNIVGQRMLDMELNGEQSINTDHFNSGVYFMIFEGTQGERATHKMIKR